MASLTAAEPRPQDRNTAPAPLTVPPLGSIHCDADLIFDRIVQHVRVHVTCGLASNAELSDMLCDLRADVDRILRAGEPDEDALESAAAAIEVLADRLEAEPTKRAAIVEMLRRLAARVLP